MVLYNVFRKGKSKIISLWRLLLRIKLLELHLQYLLQVIHVPGTSMMLQGMDAFSRGLDMQALSSYKSTSRVPLLWRLAPLTQDIIQWCLSVVPTNGIPSTSWIILPDFSD